ncbi:DUF4062 domain-containing protein [Arcobacter cryaerophilus gv. pseudocryaerophilus]|uniref:DUF4062 domain-containing protein n=2 Tax=Arcobacteraceae TaxID=2808963 RepID=A0AAU0P266_9BACT|nr:DUF4062 domain-containing protein [Arcobacter sp. AZ-2023]WPD03246.1 DUF4062 domain-containing protein [Arcobacter sp. DSM 115972]
MQNKTIKFFISSTFKDFIKERNALQNFVFPRLKKLCQDKGFSFQPVDLRWGVTNESSDDNKTMEYCLNEVKRCSSDPKPNLLILFGQRYGWVPLPSYIESNVFDIIEEKIDNINFTKELFEKEKEEWNKEATKEKEEKKKKEFLNNIDEANKYIFKNFKLKDLLKEWYIKDLNDKNQKYYLKDKRNTPTLIWRFIEKILKTYIQKVDDTKEKNNYDIFHTSATEQEIKLALKKQKVLESKNTIVYHRKFKNDTIDKDFIEEEQNEKLEKLEKYLSDNKSCSLIKKDSIDLDIYKSLKDEYISIETKSHEEKNYPKDIPEYLEDFCESVYNEFKDKINTEIDKYNDDFPTTLKIELEQQERFLKSKYFYYIDERNERKDINDVIGRNKELKEIVNFITDSENTEQYYLLYGKSGTGKTSVMAKALTEIKNKNNKYDIYYRFIGTTAYSTYSRQVFESIYREIESKLSNNENLPKVEFEIEELKFKKQFQELLQRLDDKKVVIFLDAIDQFEDDNDLSILLDDLPKNIKIIFSVLYDENKTDNNDYTKYYEKLSNIKNNTKLDILDQSFNIEILKQLLEKDNRTLSTNKDNNQQNLVESFIEDQTPLCVKLTYEIVREWTSNEDIDELKEELPSIDCENKEEELIIKFFNNVIKKYYVNEELLNFTLGLISASKDGLSETELIDIISNEEKILKSYDKDQRYQQLNKLPDAIFSKMYYHIQDIFTEKLIDGEMLINPYHRVIEEVIKNYFYKINKNQLHKKLSDYFYLKQDKNKTWNQRYYSLRMLSELPYQLYECQNSELLKEILFDLEFAGSVYDNNKHDSFRDIMSKATQLDNIKEDEIYPWESFYREKEHLILKVNDEMWKPHQTLFQLAYEDGLDSPLTEKAIILLNKDIRKPIGWNWLKIKNQNKVSSRKGLLKVINSYKCIRESILKEDKLYFKNDRSIFSLNLDSLIIKKDNYDFDNKHNINDIREKYSHMNDEQFDDLYDEIIYSIEKAEDNNLEIEQKNKDELLKNAIGYYKKSKSKLHNLDAIDFSGNNSTLIYKNNLINGCAWSNTNNESFVLYINNNFVKKEEKFKDSIKNILIVNDIYFIIFDRYIKIKDEFNKFTFINDFSNSIDKIYYDKKSDKYILVNSSEILIYRILLKNTDSIETYKYKSIDDNLIINRNKFLFNFNDETNYNLNNQNISNFIKFDKNKYLSWYEDKLFLISEVHFKEIPVKGNFIEIPSYNEKINGDNEVIYYICKITDVFYAVTTSKDELYILYYNSDENIFYGLLEREILEKFNGETNYKLKFLNDKLYLYTLNSEYGFVEYLMTSNLKKDLIKIEFDDDLSMEQIIDVPRHECRPNNINNAVKISEKNLFYLEFNEKILNVKIIDENLTFEINFDYKIIIFDQLKIFRIHNCIYILYNNLLTIIVGNDKIIELDVSLGNELFNNFIVSENELYICSKNFIQKVKLNKINEIYFTTKELIGKFNGQFVSTLDDEFISYKIGENT